MRKIFSYLKNKKKSFVDNFNDVSTYIIKKYKFDYLAKVLNKFSIIFTFIYAMIIYLIMEICSRHSIIQGILFVKNQTLVYLYNSFIIFLPFLIALFFKRRIFVRYIISVFWLALGAINGIVLAKRVTPFNAQDLKVLSDATTLINNYFKNYQIIYIISVVILVLIFTVLVFKLSPKYNGRIRYVRNLITITLSVIVFIFTTNLAFKSRILSTYFGNIAYAYQDYGLPYCFACSIFNTGIDEPEDYSQEEIAKIKKNSKLSDVVNDSDNPNIIFVQLETFFDPTEVNFLKFNKDPIPNFRKLMNEYSSGYFTAPSIGAGTSNTEFEVLTGMSMRYFGPGEYPHKTILKQKTCESMPFDLRTLGYSTHAIHNNGGNFYSRSTVFNNLGFNTYTSKEFMNILEYTEKGWAKDNVLLSSIDEALDSTDQTDYVFTITVESHGDYPEEKILEDPEITIEGLDDEGKKNSWEYYCNLLYDVDKFVNDLINMINARNEKSVIVFYGDHIPTMNLKPSDVKNKYLYNTEYVIWDNIGLEKKDQNLNAYQISAEVLNQIGIHTGTLFNYHQNRIETKDYQKDLELLQYDILYGKEYVYDENNPFTDTVMRMGVISPSIKNAVIINKVLVIRGNAFTKNSHVYIDDEKVDSSFLSNELIEVNLKNIDFNDNSKIVVSQVGSKNTIFDSSKPYYYNTANSEENATN